MRVARPFSSVSIEDPVLTRAYLRWVVATAGGGRRRVPLMVVVPAMCHPDVAKAWRDLVGSVGARPLVVERPVAALAGLGVDVATGTAHMVVDAERDGTEVAVVADGVVVDARRTPPLSEAPGETATAIRSLLVTIDPDYELDIADEGIHLVGHKAAGDDLAADLAERVGFAVILSDRPDRVVVDGAQRTMETVRPYLAQVLARRSAFRAVRGGFAR